MRKPPQRAKAARLPPDWRERLPEWIVPLLKSDVEGTIATFQQLGRAAAAWQHEIAHGLPRFKRYYRQTENPYFPLFAWNICRRAHAPVPDWVLEYVDNFIETFLSAESERPSDIAAALGFRKAKGRRLFGTAFDRFFEDRQIALMVERERKELTGGKQYLAVHGVARRLDKADSTVAAAVRRARTAKPRKR
jgi:hypothetical protein